MRYIKKYDDFKLNESLLTVGAIVFSLLFLRGLIKKLPSILDKKINKKIIKELKSLSKLLDNVKKEKLDIIKTVNGYKIKTKKIIFTITDKKITFNNMLILPYDKLIKVDSYELEITNEKIIKEFKKFIIDINNKLDKIDTN